jgi:diketogulonate reductase-like aldo/keto reductase
LPGGFANIPWEHEMEERKFGAAQRAIAVIGQGTWLVDEADRSAAIAALQRGLDVGMNHIDTAEMYGAGRAEEIIGEAIQGRRDDVFLVSKVLPENASRRGTQSACERSLKRLRTDRIDCYLLHWRGSHPLEETIAAFEHLKDAGKIRSWGVSNFDVEDLEDVRSLAGANGPVCNQVLYHLQERAIEHAVMPWCAQHGVAVVAYSPFGHDRFPRPQSPPGRVLADVAQAHGATPRQVALAFLTRHPSLFAIPKASKPKHAEENAGAGGQRLSDAETLRIDAAFPRGRRRALPVI